MIGARVVEHTVPPNRGFQRSTARQHLTRYSPTSQPTAHVRVPWTPPDPLSVICSVV